MVVEINWHMLFVLSGIVPSMLERTKKVGRVKVYNLSSLLISCHRPSTEDDAN